MQKKFIGILMCVMLLMICVIPVMGGFISFKKNYNDTSPLNASNTVLKFMIAGKAIRALHSYWIHVPPNYDGSKPVPLVLVFQGSNLNTDDPFGCFRRCIIENATKFSEKADQENFLNKCNQNASNEYLQIFFQYTKSPPVLPIFFQ